MFKKVLLLALIFLIIFTIKIEAGLIVNSKLVHQFEVGAGEKKLGEIILENNSKNEIIVRLYKRDYSFNAKGKNFYRTPGLNSRSNADWILLPEQTLTISPFAKESVEYIINTPNKQILKGTYWSMLMVEEFGSQMKNKSEIINSNFKHKVRYGIQIVTNLGRKEGLKIEYRNPEVKIEREKDYSFGIDIVNKGIFELITKPRILVINKKTGEIINKYKKRQVRLYPGTSIRVEEKILLNKKIPYKILVIVGNNRRGYQGKEYSIGVVSD